MSTVLGTDLLVAARAGDNYQITAADLAAHVISLGGDLQAAATGPTTRSNGSALEEGDLWYNTTDNCIYAWNSAAWVKKAPLVDWQSGAGFPTVTTRSDGESLIDGDQFWDTADDEMYFWNGSAWVHSDTLFQFDWQSAAGVPTATTRSDGGTLVSGDQYWDTTNNELYFWDGSAWIYTDTPFQFDWQSVAGDPSTLGVTTNSAGGTLVNGDQAWNNVAYQLHFWNGTSWDLTGRSRIVVTSSSITAKLGEYVVVEADGQTITLPAGPQPGDEVNVVVAGEFEGVIVGRNGSNIMALAEDITLDKNYAAMTFTYTDATNGWRLN